jgi:hypothetical protein
MSKSSKGNLWIEKQLVISKAFLSLTGKSQSVLLLFLYRRQWDKSGRNGKWRQINNGEILFPYVEAKKKFGISKSSFARAIDQLIERGFIDIAQLGGGLVGDCTKYSISNRWKKFGTDDFIFKSRPKDTRGFGFTKKNWEEKTGRKRKKQSIVGINFYTTPSKETDTGQDKTKSKPVSDLMQGKSDVNYFIRKGEEVFRAITYPPYQKQYSSILSHTN